MPNYPPDKVQEMVELLKLCNSSNIEMLRRQHGEAASMLEALQAEVARLRGLLETEERHSRKLAQCWVKERHTLQSKLEAIQS